MVGELLGDLMNRGLDFTVLRLYVLDGGKALHAAVRKYAGESAPIQRCQVHKRRNVLDHLTDEQKPLVAKKPLVISSAHRDSVSTFLFPALGRYHG